MTGRIDPASAVAKYVIKTPLTVDKRRALRHSKGKVSQDKLAGLPRPGRSAKKGGTNLPAQLKCTLTSMRDSGPTGTFIPIATKDGAKTAPNFLKGTRAQKLTPEERNKCESAPPTGGALSGEFAELGDVFNGIASLSLDQLKQRREQRENSGQVLRRKHGRKNLLGPAEATDKASAEAAPVAKPGKASRRAPVPTEPPPSYKESQLRKRNGAPPTYEEGVLYVNARAIAQAQQRNAAERKPRQDTMIQRKNKRVSDLKNQSGLRAAVEQRIPAAPFKLPKD